MNAPFEEVAFNSESVAKAPAAWSQSPRRARR